MNGPQTAAALQALSGYPLEQIEDALAASVAAGWLLRGDDGVYSHAGQQEGHP